MGSSHTPKANGRSQKFDRRSPGGILESWLDDNQQYQTIPLHPDLGCTEGGPRCLECRLPQCVEDLKRVRTP